MTQTGVGMTAYMIMADPDATFEFLKSTIITAVLANKQAKDAYTQSIQNLLLSTPFHSYIINTIIKEKQMPQVARVGDADTNPSHCAPVVLVCNRKCSPNVLANNIAVHRVGDSNTPHGFILCVPTQQI